MFSFLCLIFITFGSASGKARKVHNFTPTAKWLFFCLLETLQTNIKIYIYSHKIFDFIGIVQFVYLFKTATATA